MVMPSYFIVVKIQDAKDEPTRVVYTTLTFDILFSPALS